MSGWFFKYKAYLGKIIFHLKWKILQFRYAVWDKRPWRGNYRTAAEQTVMPHINDSIFWFCLGWIVLFLSLAGEIFVEKFDTAFQRAGAVLVACGILIEMKVHQLRVSISLIAKGQMSPQGFIHSAHLPGMFVQDWSKEKIHEKPVSLWLWEREYDAIKFETNAFWALLLGQLYGPMEIYWYKDIHKQLRL